MVNKELKEQSKKKKSVNYIEKTNSYKWCEIQRHAKRTRLATRPFGHLEMRIKCVWIVYMLPGEAVRWRQGGRGPQGCPSFHFSLVLYSKNLGQTESLISNKVALQNYDGRLYGFNWVLSVSKSQSARLWRRAVRRQSGEYRTWWKLPWEHRCCANLSRADGVGLWGDVKNRKMCARCRKKGGR